MEAEVLKIVDFDLELINELRSLAKSELKQLPAIDEETGDIHDGYFYKGIYFEPKGQEIIEIVKRLKLKYREIYYLFFVFEAQYGKESIAVIEGIDELDILRYIRTDGVNYGLENQDIINKLSEWKSMYGLSILGCGRDWIQIEFSTPPSSLDLLTKEIHEFCPELANQGVTIDTTKQEIIEKNGIYLWWD